MMSVIITILAVEWLGTLALLLLCNYPNEVLVYRRMLVVSGTILCILIILEQLAIVLGLGV